MASAQRSFEAEALPHLPALRRVALRWTRSPADADDVVQEALLRAWRFRKSYQPGTDCRAWLIRIARNVFLTGVGAAGRERAVLAAAEACPGSLLAGAGRDPGRAEEEALGRIPSAAVGRALKALPVAQRAAILAVDAGGASYAEAALAAGCPVGTAMSRVFRARRALRASLGRMEGGEDARRAAAA